MHDLPYPSPTAVQVALTGAPVSAKARIAFYSSDEWEEFIYEWAHGLAVSYAQIKRFGGSGDKGADIAAFKTERGLEGPWDCYQGKHYARSLTLSDAAPEMLKVFLAVLDGHYVMPDSYRFLAPRGCATSLNKLLSQPTKLREALLNKLADGQPLAAALETARLAKVRELVTSTDFATFKSVELADALEVHRSTPWHSARFATSLKPRPAHKLPPVDVAPHETRYVSQLFSVYCEKHPEEDLSVDSLAFNARIGQHFQRQRESFYKAESLRVYARDSVPPGTFDKLQDDIHSGVIDTAEADYGTGFERLSNVLSLVGQLDLSRHTLIAVTEIDDRKGICHQLANVDRLTWSSQP
ncbi:ABC-three component system protein [Blastococcus sp. SYSU DS0617]